MIQVRASDVLDKWLGGSEALIRSLFAKARSASPCILFLDEIDSLAGNRQQQQGDDDAGTTNDFSSRILSTLLNEMDGISSSGHKSQVLVIACTNRLESLDAALLRPGRLQEHMFLDLPNVQDLQEILALRLSGIPVDAGVSMEELSTTLFANGAMGADVEGLCREACMISMRHCSSLGEVKVTLSHFQQAISERFGAE